MSPDRRRTRRRCDRPRCRSRSRTSRAGRRCSRRSRRSTGRSGRRRSSRCPRLDRAPASPSAQRAPCARAGHASPVARDPERRVPSLRGRAAAARERGGEDRESESAPHGRALERTAPVSVARTSPRCGPTHADRRLRLPLRLHRASVDVQRAPSAAVFAPCRHGVDAVAARCARASSSVGGPPCSPKNAQYQSTLSPGSRAYWSAPTGGETPFTLYVHPLEPKAA